MAPIAVACSDPVDSNHDLSPDPRLHALFHTASLLKCATVGAEIAELDTVHRAQAIIKRTNKIGLKEAYVSDEDVQNVVECLVSLPLLPPEEIVAAIDDVEVHVLVDSSHENQLR